MTDSLDKIDLEIVELLSSDGRMSDTEIAKKVGLSKTSVRLRKLKLINSGKIRILGIPILKNLNLVDSDVQIKFKVNTPQEKIDEFVKKLQEEEYIYEINRYLYRYDVSIAVYHDNFASLKIYLQGIFEGVEDLESFEIYPVVHTDKAFGVVL